MSMQCIEVRQLYRGTAAHLNQPVTLAGWVRTARGSKGVLFVELNDGSFFTGVQVVVDKERFPKPQTGFGNLSNLTVGSAIEVSGTLVASPAKGQDFEVKAEKITVISLAPEDYPLQKKRHSFEYLRTIAHLRPRTNTYGAMYRLRSALSFAIHQFFNERGFTYVHTPILTASDCEGAGEMFQVTTFDLNNVPKSENGGVKWEEDFFGTAANLTVSGQLNGEAAALALRNIYTFGPTFRAEHSNTARHAAEFWMVEPEVAFNDLSANMDLAEAMLKYMVVSVLEKLPEEMAFFNQFIDTSLMDRINLIKDSEFGRVTYTEAIALLEKSGQAFEYPVKWGIDLQTEHERYLAETVFQKPVFVTDYPKDIKAFYMRMNDDNTTVAAMDLLVPGVGELIGGSQREERAERLEARMNEAGLDTEAYRWYLDLRRFGGVVHSGFGLGFERAVMYLSGIQNIRDAVPFPRTPKNIAF